MPFQKTFRILLEEDNTDGSILDSFGGASFLALNGTDASGAMNADSVVLGVDGTAAEGKPHGYQRTQMVLVITQKKSVSQQIVVGSSCLVQLQLEVITQMHNQR